MLCQCLLIQIPVMNNVGTRIRNLDYEYDILPMLHRNRFNYLSIISLDNEEIFYTGMLKLSPTKIIRVERQSSGWRTDTKYLPVY